MEGDETLYQNDNKMPLEAAENNVMPPNEDDPASLVYSREEYAKKEFWDDRFKESKGFFDWYANWSEIKPVFEKHLKDRITSPGETNTLMVGCGNSKLSEEMAKDNYHKLTNMDISQVVLEKMKNHNKDKEECKDFEYVEMDATNMTFEDDKFDLTIDKGTYDALACDPKDKTMIKKLFLEMIRVTKPTGAVVIITNGIPVKRLPDFQEFTKDMENINIEHDKIELSSLS